MKQRIKAIIRDVLPSGFEGEILISRPDVPEHGDYSTNVAFALAKNLKKSPKEVAEEIVQKIQDTRNKEQILFSRTEVAGAGFINFWISAGALLEQIEAVLQKPDGWGKSDEGKGKRVKIEYFQPNVAKVPHVGHLRSAVIGDSLKRVLLSRGYEVLSDTHIGDWGTQFGILLYGWQELSKEEQEEIRKNPIEGLNDLYVAEGRKIEAEPERREKGKEEFAKLERGDEENRKLWEWMVEVSMAEFEEIIARLHLLPFEEHRGESAYEEAMPPFVRWALKEGVAEKGDGELVFADLEDVGLGHAIFIKSDGASTYLLRDLATLAYWCEKELEKNLYVVDVRQSHHFRQVFEVGRRLGLSVAERSEHVVFGLMSLPEGAMSTRKGNVVGLLDVLDDVRARAREVTQEKNPELKEKERVAEDVGVGALKYFDLSHHPKSNIVFDKEKSLSFEGNTGPYLQYAHARLRSILKKSLSSKFEILNNLKLQNSKFEMNENERQLLAEALRFPEVVELVAESYAPNALASYLFELASKVNEFYHAVPVLKEEDEEKRVFRLGLVEVVSTTLKNGLGFLGIGAPEEM